MRCTTLCCSCEAHLLHASDPFARFSVMHYFEFSPFFDRGSSNSVARRQNLDPAVPGVLE